MSFCFYAVSVSILVFHDLKSDGTIFLGLRAGSVHIIAPLPA